MRVFLSRKKIIIFVFHSDWRQVKVMVCVFIMTHAMDGLLYFKAVVVVVVVELRSETLILTLTHILLLILFQVSHSAGE